jgi:hypothetical protein
MHGRLIGIYPTRLAAFGNDAKKLRKWLNKKGSKYNRLDKPLDKPLVVAMMTWNSVFDPTDRKMTRVSGQATATRRSRVSF